jgi:hypothetical protein
MGLMSTEEEALPPDLFLLNFCGSGFVITLFGSDDEFSDISRITQATL